ncbi:unnamed protein product [Amoebophrya sp. A120]|nr:unnamed protein product [Amoebophrya sp. A120]|eukprot:GSA120T00021213001.1
MESDIKSGFVSTGDVVGGDAETAAESAAIQASVADHSASKRDSSRAGEQGQPAAVGATGRGPVPETEQAISPPTAPGLIPVLAQTTDYNSSGRSARAGGVKIMTQEPGRRGIELDEADVVIGQPVVPVTGAGIIAPSSSSSSAGVLPVGEDDDEIHQPLPGSSIGAAQPPTTVIPTLVVGTSASSSSSSARQSKHKPDHTSSKSVMQNRSGAREGTGQNLLFATSTTAPSLDTTNLDRLRTKFGMLDASTGGAVGSRTNAGSYQNGKNYPVGGGSTSPNTAAELLRLHRGSRNNRNNPHTSTASSSTRNINSMNHTNHAREIAMLRNALQESEQERQTMRRQYAVLGEKIDALSERYENDVGNYKAKCHKLRTKYRQVLEQKELGKEEEEKRKQEQKDEINDLKKQIFQDQQNQEVKLLEQARSNEADLQQQMQFLSFKNAEERNKLVKKVNEKEEEADLFRQKLQHSDQKKQELFEENKRLESENDSVFKRLKESYLLLEKLRTIINDERKEHTRKVEQIENKHRYEADTMLDAQKLNYEKVLTHSKLINEKSKRESGNIADDIRLENHELRQQLMKKEEDHYNLQHSLDRATFLLDQHKQHVVKLEERVDFQTGVFSRKKREAMLAFTTEQCQLLKQELNQMKVDVKNAEKIFTEKMEKGIRKMLQLETLIEDKARKAKEYDSLLKLHRTNNVILLKTGEELLKTRFHVQVSTNFVRQILTHLFDGCIKPWLRKELENLYEISIKENITILAHANIDVVRNCVVKNRMVTETRVDESGEIVNAKPLLNWESCTAPSDAFCLPYLLSGDDNFVEQTSEMIPPDMLKEIAEMSGSGGDESPTSGSPKTGKEGAKSSSRPGSPKSTSSSPMKSRPGTTATRGKTSKQNKDADNKNQPKLDTATKKTLLYETAKVKLENLFEQIDDMRNRLCEELSEVEQVEGYYDIVSQWQALMTDSSMKEQMGKAAAMLSIAHEKEQQRTRGKEVLEYEKQKQREKSRKKQDRNYLSNVEKEFTKDPVQTISEHGSHTSSPAFLELAKLLLQKLQKRALYATKKIRSEAVFDESKTPGVPPMRGLLLLQQQVVTNSKMRNLHQMSTMYQRKEHTGIAPSRSPRDEMKNEQLLDSNIETTLNSTENNNMDGVRSQTNQNSGNPLLFYQESKRSIFSGFDDEPLEGIDVSFSGMQSAGTAALQLVDSFIDGKQMGLTKEMKGEELPILAEEIADAEELCFFFENENLPRDSSPSSRSPSKSTTRAGPGGAHLSSSKQTTTVVIQKQTLGLLMKQAVEVTTAFRTDLLTLEFDEVILSKKNEKIEKLDSQIKEFWIKKVNQLVKKNQFLEKQLDVNSAEKVADEMERLRKQIITYEKKLTLAEEEIVEWQNRVDKREGLLTKVMAENKQQAFYGGSGGGGAGAGSRVVVQKQLTVAASGSSSDMLPSSQHLHLPTGTSKQGTSYDFAPAAVSHDKNPFNTRAAAENDGRERSERDKSDLVAPQHILPVAGPGAGVVRDHTVVRAAGGQQQQAQPVLKTAFISSSKPTSSKNTNGGLFDENGEFVRPEQGDGDEINGGKRKDYSRSVDAQEEVGERTEDEGKTKNQDLREQTNQLLYYPEAVEGEVVPVSRSSRPSDMMQHLHFPPAETRPTQRGPVLNRVLGTTTASEDFARVGTTGRIDVEELLKEVGEIIESRHR